MLTLAWQDATQVALVMSFVVIGWLLVSLGLRALGISAVTGVKKQKLAGKLSETTEEEESGFVDELAKPKIRGRVPTDELSTAAPTPETSPHFRRESDPLDGPAGLLLPDFELPDAQEESCVRDVERADAGLSLLEHYGVFGSEPGAWTTKCPYEGLGELPQPPLAILTDPLECLDPDGDFQKELESLASEESPLMARRVLGSRTPRGLSLLEHYGVFGVSPKCWGGSKVDGFGQFLTSLT